MKQRNPVKEHTPVRAHHIRHPSNARHHVNSGVLAVKFIARYLRNGKIARKSTNAELIDKYKAKIERYITWE